MGTAIGDGVVDLRVAGAVCRDAAELPVFLDPVERARQHWRIGDMASGDPCGPTSSLSSSKPGWILRQFRCLEPLDGVIAASLLSARYPHVLLRIALYRQRGLALKRFDMGWPVPGCRSEVAVCSCILARTLDARDETFAEFVQQSAGITMVPGNLSRKAP